MKVSKNYAVDCSVLKWLPLYGFQLFTLSISGQLSKKVDHSPRLSVYFVVFNFLLIEFEFYNINHAE